MKDRIRVNGQLFEAVDKSSSSYHGWSIDSYSSDDPGSHVITEYRATKDDEVVVVRAYDSERSDISGSGSVSVEVYDAITFRFFNIPDDINSILDAVDDSFEDVRDWIDDLSYADLLHVIGSSSTRVSRTIEDIFCKNIEKVR